VEELVGILGIVFMVIVLPLVIIMHYVTKWKSTKGLSFEEQQMLEDLWDSSERMSGRLDVLERILDETRSEK
jgi:phage shock protein B